MRDIPQLSAKSAGNPIEKSGLAYIAFMREKGGGGVLLATLALILPTLAATPAAPFNTASLLVMSSGDEFYSCARTMSKPQIGMCARACEGKHKEIVFDAVLHDSMNSSILSGSVQQGAFGSRAIRFASSNASSVTSCGVFFGFTSWNGMPPTATHFLRKQEKWVAQKRMKSCVKTSDSAKEFWYTIHSTPDWGFEGCMK